MRQEVVHHPSGEFLIDYASGSASEAVSLLVATHLALCPVCRQGVAALETIGSQALEPAGADPTSLPALPAHTHPRAVEAQLRTVGSETLFQFLLNAHVFGIHRFLPDPVILKRGLFASAKMILAEVVGNAKDPGRNLSISVDRYVAKS